MDRAARCLVILLIGLAPAPVFSEGQNLSGQFAAYFLGLRGNEGALAGTSTQDFDTILAQEITVAFDLGPITRIVTQFELRGTLANVTQGTSTTVAPVAIGVNQFYLQLPFGDTVVLTLGKRVKEIGEAEFYPLVNRINPRLYSNTGVSSLGAGLIDVSWSFLDTMSLSSTAFFRNSADNKWDEIDFLTQLSCQTSFLNASLYVYREKVPGNFLDTLTQGASLSTQIEFLKLYGEYLRSHTGSTRFLKTNPGGDPSQDLIPGEPRLRNSVVIGTQYVLSTFSLTIEGTYSEDSYSPRQADEVSDYFRRILSLVDSRDQRLALVSLYGPGESSLPFRGTVAVVYSPEAWPEWSVMVGSQGSWMGWERQGHFAGYSLQAGVTYNYRSGITLGLTAVTAGGGKDSPVQLYGASAARSVLSCVVAY